MEKENIGSVSLVRQGRHTFYSFTIDSDVLAETCFVSTREEDPDQGFQRDLDKNRAKEIATYIDKGLGTIPSSIILSAQEVSNFNYVSKSKTVSFDKASRAFLIIDGQHRIYGFKLAESNLRVPVVVYSGLSRQDEVRLFIDINSKQKGVRPELLLDIKKLADTESSKEEFFREIFDLFFDEKRSSLYGKLSPRAKVKGKLSRATFNSALGNIFSIIEGKNEQESYEIIDCYINAFINAVLAPENLEKYLTVPIVFMAVIAFLPTMAMRVKDKFGAVYSIDNFYDVLKPIKIKKTKIEGHGRSYRQLLNYFIEASKSNFIL